MLITFRFHLSISCSCNFHDTISQQLHCRFRPYVSRKAATPSQSASHNPLIPIREMLGANKTTCPLPQCGTSKCHQTPIFKSNPSPVRAGRIQRVPCFQTQAFYIWARFWLQFLGIYNFFLNLGSKQASMTKAYHSLTKPARWFAYCLKH